MKKLILLLLFIPLLVPFFISAQEDIERFKLYNTENINLFLKLDTSFGKISLVQYALEDVEAIDIPLHTGKFAYSKETLKMFFEDGIDLKKLYSDDFKTRQLEPSLQSDLAKGLTFEEYLKTQNLAQIGRFELYPTKNIYNFIMLDVINGETYQVQWSFEYEKRFVSRITKQ